ncbi:uncharacterized protein LOC131956584 [Physella acuta]|uniref:uncharacterized protein LOC131956584 n=1 Tax=Physella acuta TaxID=109671 RepID=UPI0027DC6A39|nr:uncharacterized protein LOC131956584 [Physella acuta]
MTPFAAATSTILLVVFNFYATSFSLPFLEKNYHLIDLSTNRQEDIIPSNGNEEVDKKEKFGSNDLQGSVHPSPVPPIWTLLRRVGRIHDNKTESLTRHTLVLNVSHDIDRLTDDMHDLKQTDASDIRNDIKVKRNDIELKDEKSEVVRNNVTKIEVKSQLRKRSEKICTLSQERALILIKRIEHEYFELAGQAERVTGDDSQEVEYYLYKYTSGGFIKMIYRIDKCYHRVNSVSYNKTTFGAPCKSRAFAIGGSSFMGPIFFGRRPFCLLTSFSNDSKKCILANKYVKAVDVRGVSDLGIGNKTDPLEFDCKKVYLDGNNGALSPLMDAFFYATQAQQMLEKWFNYTRLQKPPIMVKVHYGLNVANAYQNNISLEFGDGDDHHTSLATSPNIVGHELGHMILSRDTTLYSLYPVTPASGGLSEAFADIFGKTVEFYIFGMFDWSTGSWVTKSGLPYRYMDTPDMQFQEDLVHKNSGHYNGGVFSRVFYRMAKFWGIRATMESLMIAKNMFWNYNMSRYDSIACSILRGGYYAGLDMYEIERFFKTVGIDTTNLCPIESMSVTRFNVRAVTKIKVSCRRRPFFQLYDANHTYIVVMSNPKTVRIVVTTDRQGRKPLQRPGLGTLKVKDTSLCCGPVYIHFSTGVLAEKRAEIRARYED